MLAVEGGEVCGAVSFLELGLAVDAFVVVTEEAVDEVAVSCCDTLEAMLFDVFELRDHVFVDLEVLCAVLSRVAEGLAAETSEGQEAGHAEGGVDKDAQVAAKLLCIHRAHGSGDDEVGAKSFDLLTEKGHSVSRHDRDVRGYDLHTVLIEGIAE